MVIKLTRFFMAVILLISVFFLTTAILDTLEHRMGYYDDASLTGEP